MLRAPAAVSIVLMLAACDDERLTLGTPGTAARDAACATGAACSADAARDASALAADAGSTAADATTLDDAAFAPDVPPAPDAAVADAGAPTADAAAADASAPDAARIPDAGPVSCPTAPTARPTGTLRTALPSVVWWGAGYTIVLDQVVSEAAFQLQLFLEQTDATGARTAGPTPLTPAGTQALWPRIAYSGAEYGVTYLEGAGRAAAWVRADANLQPIAGSHVVVAASAGAVAVAWGHGQWAVVWSAPNTSGVQLQRFDAAGQPLGPPSTLGPGFISDAGQPIVTTPRGFAVIATDYGDGHLYEVDPQGTVRVVELPFRATRASIATDGVELAVVAGDRGCNYARLPIGGAFDPARSGSLGGANCQVPSLIASGGQFLAIWSDTINGSPAPLRLGALPAGGAGGGAPFSTQSNAGFSHAAAGSCGWAVVYQTFTPRTLSTLEVRP